MLISYPYEYEKARFLIYIMFRELRMHLMGSVTFGSNCLSSNIDKYFIYVYPILFNERDSDMVVKRNYIY